MSAYSAISAKKRRRQAAKKVARWTWAGTKWTAKRAWRHRTPLAPTYAITSGYALSTLEHTLGGHGTITLATTGIAALALHKWRGIPTPTKLRTSTKWERAHDATTWGTLTATAALGTATAITGPGIPLPGLWAIAALGSTIAWASVLATRPTPQLEQEKKDPRRTIWGNRVAVSGGAIPESILGKIRAVDGHSLIPDLHLGPVIEREGWSGDVSLQKIGDSAQKVLAPSGNTVSAVAAAYRTRSLNVLLSRGDSEREDTLKVTVMTKNPSVSTIEYKPEEWQVMRDGCIPIAVSPDGTIPQYCLWEPGSGAQHGFISGDSGSGKSRGTELILTGACATGHVVPVILDPQGGASLPSWAGHSGVAPVIGRDHEAIETIFGALDQVAQERANFLAHLGVDHWDVEKMHREYGRPMIMVVLDEAHMVMQINPVIVQYVARAVKTWRKLGMKIQLITQTPNLTELGGDQSVRANLQRNVVSFRVSSSEAKGMILPTDAPNPRNIPKSLDNQKTNGMCVVSTGAPFGTVGNYVRFPLLGNDLGRSEALRIAQTKIPDLEPSAAKLLGVDTAAWRRRVDDIAEGVAKPDASQTHLVAAEKKKAEEVILAYLEERKGQFVQNSQIIADLNMRASTVSTTLKRMSDKNLVESPSYGLWEYKKQP